MYVLIFGKAEKGSSQKFEHNTFESAKIQGKTVIATGIATWYQIIDKSNPRNPVWTQLNDKNDDDTSIITVDTMMYHVPNEVADRIRFELKRYLR